MGMIPVEKGSEVQIKESFETEFGRLEKGSIGVVKQIISNYGPEAECEVEFSIGRVRVLVPFEAESVARDEEGMYRRVMAVKATDVHLKDRVFVFEKQDTVEVFGMEIGLGLVYYSDDSGSVFHTVDEDENVVVRRLIDG